MRFKKTIGRVLLAGVLSSMLAMSATVAGASAQAPGKRGQKSLAKQLKALKLQTKALADQVAALAGQNKTLAGQNQGLVDAVAAVAKHNAALQQKVTALGSEGTLFGTKLLDLETKGPPNLRPDSVDTSIIRDGGILEQDLAVGAVGAFALQETFQAIATTGTVITRGQQGVSSVTCPVNMQLLSGGWEWGNNSPGFRNVRVLNSRPAGSLPLRTWEVLGEVVDGPNNALVATAVCLRP